MQENNKTLKELEKLHHKYMKRQEVGCDVVNALNMWLRNWGLHICDEKFPRCMCEWHIRKMLRGAIYMFLIVSIDVIAKIYWDLYVCFVVLGIAFLLPWRLMIINNGDFNEYSNLYGMLGSLIIIWEMRQ